MTGTNLYADFIGEERPLSELHGRHSHPQDQLVLQLAQVRSHVVIYARPIRVRQVRDDSPPPWSVPFGISPMRLIWTLSISPRENGPRILL